jgi:SAM-dependent methyltransferase
VADDRERLRATFDSAADRYEHARPEYPDDLYAELIRLTELHAGDRVLEIGCATGKATRPLAAHGVDLTCLELGGDLVTAARHNLARLPNVEVVHADFETWKPPPGTAFDLVFAATAWHWVDPAIRLRKAADLLRPGGHLAYWGATHVFLEGGDPFFREIQEVYEEIGEGLPAGAPWPRPGELADDRAELEASGWFDRVEVEHFDWEVIYDAESYLALLDTFSGHIAMEPWQRERLDAEIRRRLAARADGRLRRHWGAVLQVARRRSSDSGSSPSGTPSAS